MRSTHTIIYFTKNLLICCTTETLLLGSVRVEQYLQQLLSSTAGQARCEQADASGSLHAHILS